MENNEEIKSLTKEKRNYTKKSDKNRFFFPDEYMRTFDAMKEKQQHTMKVLLNTGARINEARHIKVEDIDFINRRITLKMTKTKAKKGETHGRVRIIPISSEFTKYLKRYTSTKNQQEPLSILSTPGFDIAIKKAAAHAGIKDAGNFSAHNLRKTLEVWLMALGVDSLKLTAHIGHDIRTAAQHYVSPDIFSYEEKQKMRMILNDLYNNDR